MLNKFFINIGLCLHAVNLVILIELDMKTWESLGVPTKILKALSDQGFTSPTPIQTLSLPPAIFHHRDIIGAAETVS